MAANLVTEAMESAMTKASSSEAMIGSSGGSGGGGGGSEMLKFEYGRRVTHINLITFPSSSEA